MNETLKRELINLIKERRSISFFDNTKEVDDQILKEIIEIASTAPSGYNIQPWKIAIIKSKQNKSILKSISFNQQKVEDASVNIVILANSKAGIENVEKVIDSWISLGYIKQEQKEQLKQSIINSWNDPEKAKIKAIRDSSMFAMNIMLAARIFGLETHPIEGFDKQKLIQFLELPEHLIPIMIICLGYFDNSKQLLPRAYRFSLEEISYKII